jgi:hypothetical protein
LSGGREARVFRWIDNDGDGKIDSLDGACIANYEYEIFDDLDNIVNKTEAQLDEFLVDVKKLDDARKYYLISTVNDTISILVDVYLGDSFSDSTKKALKNGFSEHLNETISDEILERFRDDIVVAEWPKIREVLLEFRGKELKQAIIKDILEEISQNGILESGLVGESLAKALEELQERSKFLKELLNPKDYYLAESERIEKAKKNLEDLAEAIRNEYRNNKFNKQMIYKFNRIISANYSLLNYFGKRSETMETFSEVDDGWWFFISRFLGGLTGTAASIFYPPSAFYFGPTTLAGNVGKLYIDYKLWTATIAYLQEGGAFNSTGIFTTDVAGAIITNTTSILDAILKQSIIEQEISSEIVSMQEIVNDSKKVFLIGIRNTSLKTIEYKMVVHTKMNIPIQFISWLPPYLFRLPIAYAEPSEAEWININPGEIVYFNVPIPDDIFRFYKQDETITINPLEKHGNMIYGIDAINLNTTVENADLNIVSAKLNSPGELRIVDSLGRKTGMINGLKVQEIPDSYYDINNHGVIVFYPNSDLIYEIEGNDNGEYGLEISNSTLNTIKSFNIDRVKIKDNIKHSFILNWEDDDEGNIWAHIEIDENGDGTPEYSTEIGNEFTDEIAPTSTVWIQSKDEDDYTPTETITFTAEDNEGGVGVRYINYSLDGLNWQVYEEPLILSDPGTYTIHFNSEDWFGNFETPKSQTIVVNARPEITLNGDSEIIIYAGETFTDPGATATDFEDGTVTVTVGGDTVDTSTPGIYTITYDAVDSHGASAEQKTRTVIVLQSARGMKEQALDILQGADTGSTKTDRSLKSAVRMLQKALTNRYWDGNNALNQTLGFNVFQSEQSSIRQIQNAIRIAKRRGSLSEQQEQQLNEVIALLTKSNRILAEFAIAEVKESDYSSSRYSVLVKGFLKKAEQYFASGTAQEESNPAKAIDLYGNAWKLCSLAMRFVGR